MYRTGLHKQCLQAIVLAANFETARVNFINSDASEAIVRFGGVPRQVQLSTPSLIFELLGPLACPSLMRSQAILLNLARVSRDTVAMHRHADRSKKLRGPAMPR